MRPDQKHWIDPHFLAPNVMEVDVPLDVLEPVMQMVPQLRNVSSQTSPTTIQDRMRLSAFHPGENWSSDILWLSQADIATFGYFEDLFRSLGVAGHVASNIDFARDIILYSGFFVTRRHCDRPYFHQDWINGNNDAFTFMTPLSDNCGEMGLSYVNARGETCRYQYRIGKGIIFGDFFMHSTEPGHTKQPVVLLCLTFGTDKMDNWTSISQTAANQGLCHRRPDGIFVKNGKAWP